MPAGHLDVGAEPHEVLGRVRPTGRLGRGAGEAADQLAGQVLQRAVRAARAVPLEDPGLHRPQPVQRLDELVLVERAADPRVHGGDDVALGGVRAERREIHRSRDHGVLEVVHRVGDVVGEVHDLRLDAPALAGRALPQPVERRGVLRVVAELRAAARVADGVVETPRVLDARVEAGSREVEAVGRAVRAEHLRLEAREQPQRLRVALEAADVLRPLGERPLAVVPERRMPEVVREAGGVDDVGCEAEASGELAAHLRDLERVREAVAGEVEPDGRARAPGSWRPGGAARSSAAGVRGRGRSRCAGRSAPRAATARGRPRRRTGRRRAPDQPPLVSSSAPAISERPSASRLRESSHRSGRAGDLGLPARPRWPSAASPG